MPDRASRFVTIKAPGTGIGKSSGNPGGGVTVLIGDGGARITDGFGGWEIVPRPRKTGMTLWTGFQPITLEIPLIFHTKSREYDEGKELENDCATLAQLAGRGEPVAVPARGKSGKPRTVTVKRGQTAASIAHNNGVTLADLLEVNNLTDPAKVRYVKGKTQKLIIPVKGQEKEPFGEPPVITLVTDPPGALIPFNQPEVGHGELDRKEWVIQGIEWGTARRNIYGDRTRQDATITVVQYVAPAVTATKPAPWRRTTKHKRGKGKSKSKTKK